MVTRVGYCTAYCCISVEQSLICLWAHFRCGSLGRASPPRMKKTARWRRSARCGPTRLATEFPSLRQQQVRFCQHVASTYLIESENGSWSGLATSRLSLCNACYQLAYRLLCFCCSLTHCKADEQASGPKLARLWTHWWF